MRSCAIILVIGLLVGLAAFAGLQSIHHQKMLVAVSPKLYERFTVGAKRVLVAGVTADERKVRTTMTFTPPPITSALPF